MLYAFQPLLCLKLCWHNRLKPNPEEKSGAQAGVGCNMASVQLRVYRLYYDDLFMSFGHIHIPTTGQEPDKL